MKNLSDINVVKSLLSRHGFQFSKALGQNFLINPEICPKMATECGADQTKGVIEVGPGFGVLTRELAARANKVVAIELDKRLPAVLAETLRDCDNVKVVQADVMEVDLHQLIQDEFSGLDVLVCANLPYYISRYHEIAGRKASGGISDGYGTKRSGCAYLCSSRYTCLRCSQRSGAILQPATDII